MRNATRTYTTNAPLSLIISSLLIATLLALTATSLSSSHSFRNSMYSFASSTRARKHTFTRSNIGRQSEFLFSFKPLNLHSMMFDCWSVSRALSPPQYQTWTRLYLSLSICPFLARTIRPPFSVARTRGWCSPTFHSQGNFPLPSLRKKLPEGQRRRKKKNRNVLSVLEYCNVLPAPDRSDSFCSWASSRTKEKSWASKGEAGTGSRKNETRADPGPREIKERLARRRYKFGRHLDSSLSLQRLPFSFPFFFTHPSGYSYSLLSLLGSLAFSFPATENRPRILTSVSRHPGWYDLDLFH